MHAGEGGSDSKLFIKDLSQAYCKYGDRKGLRWEIVSDEPGSTTILFTGKQASSFFDNEPGKHCVQRVPPTERGSRPHTSIVSVAVLPILEYSNTVLDPDDIEVHIARGSGKGGQKRNKTSTQVRMRHKPTGFSVCIDSRDQQQNKKLAMKILSARVAAFRKAAEDRSYDNNRKCQLDGGGRSNKIRTYNFVKNFCADHRLKTRSSRLKQVMKGDFDLILK